MEDRQILKQAVDELPVVMREVLVLRELEVLSYREIAEVANIPLGTVMSSLWRARVRIRMLLMNPPNKPNSRRQYQPTTGSPQNYDVTADGQRFLMVKASEHEQAAPTQINVVLNWFEELKQKVPAGKK